MMHYISMKVGRYILLNLKMETWKKKSMVSDEKFLIVY